MGRDLFSRVLYGTRRSLLIGIAAVVVALSLGVSLGLTAGLYRNRFWDLLISSSGMIVLSVPFFLLCLVISTLLQVRGLEIVLVIGVVGWVYSMRIVRGETVRLLRSPFVLAGHAHGFSRARILLKCVLPNLMDALLPIALFGIAEVIAIEAGLSFLGIGVTGADPSLGAMIFESRTLMMPAWWLFLFPCAALVFTISLLSLAAERLDWRR